MTFEKTIKNLFWDLFAVWVVLAVGCFAYEEMVGPVNRFCADLAIYGGIFYWWALWMFLYLYVFPRFAFRTVKKIAKLTRLI